MASNRPSQVHVLAELERLRVQYSWSSAEEVKLRCPFHDDETPSCNVNVKTGEFICRVQDCVKGRQGGDFITLLAGVLKRSRSEVLDELATRYDLEDVKIVEPKVIERYCDAIWSAPALLKALYDRGLTDDMIKVRKLGEHKGRVQIPVFNRRGDCVNIRAYLPGAPGPDKMKNQRGRGAARWYMPDQLEYDAVMICGGECKAIVAREQLNKHGVGATCITSGEKLITPKLLEPLVGKVVYVQMDVDDAGRAAAYVNCQALHKRAAELYDVVLPLDLAKFPKGDTNDFVVNGGDLWALIESIEEEWQPKDVYRGGASSEPPVELTLSAASNARHAGKRVKVVGVVSMMETAPYFVPKDVVVECSRDQPFCSLCPVFNKPDGEFMIESENPAILEVIDTSKQNLRQAIMNGVGVPQACRVCDTVVKTHYNAEDVRLMPQLEITNRASDRALQPAVCIGEGLELNESYAFTGRLWPNPRTQQSTLLISAYDPTKDALSTYQAKDLDRLTMFRPREWSLEAVRERLDEVYDDLEANVTRIWQRRPIHIVCDLAYHSPLHIAYDGRVQKGWTEVLVIGDTAQGKSEIACGADHPGGLMAFYELGAKVVCKSASRAGLVGGIQSSDGKFWVSWGAFPTHDKRLIILEELKGLSTETIGEMTDMRSSGVAELQKIERRRTLARVRIIATSNARFDRPLSAYQFGIDAIMELIGNPEDVRRFDMCVVAERSEVDPAVLNRYRDQRPVVEHRHTSELCRSLILWSWTRTPQQTSIPQDTVEAIAAVANELCDKYSDGVPLIDRGSIRMKIARLSASLAARTFSTTDDMETLLVRPCHVQFVKQFMDAEYSKPSVGYERYSNTMQSIDKVADPEIVKKHLSIMPNAREVVQSMLRKDTMDLQDLQDWCGWDHVDARHMLSLLVRKHAVTREGREYQKTGSFVALLKYCLDNGVLQQPDHVKPKTEEF